MASTIITTNAKTLSRAADALVSKGTGLSKNTILNSLAAAIAGPGHDWGYLKNAPGAFVQPGLCGPEAEAEGEKQTPMSAWVVEYNERENWSRSALLFASKEAALLHISEDYSWWRHPDHPYEEVMHALSHIGEYTFETEDDEDNASYRIRINQVPVLDVPAKPDKNDGAPVSDTPCPPTARLVFFNAPVSLPGQDFDWDTLVFENENTLLSYAKEYQLEASCPNWRSQVEPAQDCEITATFQPEAWVNDQAMVVGCEGDQNWPVAASELDLAHPDLDYLQNSRKAPDWVRQWSGPFTITLNITHKKHPG
jgi:hypothetical protein